MLQRHKKHVMFQLAAGIIALAACVDGRQDIFRIDNSDSNDNVNNDKDNINIGSPSMLLEDLFEQAATPRFQLRIRNNKINSNQQRELHRKQFRQHLAADLLDDLLDDINFEDDARMSIVVRSIYLKFV
jgi:hypothetical protein